ETAGESGLGKESRHESSLGRRSADTARDRRDTCAVANAGTISASNREGYRRRRSTCLFSKRSSAARIWLEPARIVARRQVSIRQSAKARTIRSDDRSG